MYTVTPTDLTFNRRCFEHACKMNTIHAGVFKTAGSGSGGLTTFSQQLQIFLQWIGVNI